MDRLSQRWKHNLTGRLFVEQIAIIRFQQQAHLYHSAHEQSLYKDLVENPLSCLIYMRHFGSPTRLVDWSASFWVSAYFACHQCPKDPGYIFHFDRYRLTQLVGDRHGAETTTMWNAPNGKYNLFDPNWVKKAADWVSCYYLKGRGFPRLESQQGFFTLASKPYLDHWPLIRKVYKYGDPGFGFGVIKIPARLKPAVLQGLSTMGITGGSIYAGLDGLGHTLSSFVAFSHLDMGVMESLGLKWRTDSHRKARA